MPDTLPPPPPPDAPHPPGAPTTAGPKAPANEGTLPGAPPKPETFVQKLKDSGGRALDSVLKPVAEAVDRSMDREAKSPTENQPKVKPRGAIESVVNEVKKVYGDIKKNTPAEVAKEGAKQWTEEVPKAMTEPRSDRAFEHTVKAVGGAMEFAYGAIETVESIRAPKPPVLPTMGPHPDRPTERGGAPAAPKPPEPARPPDRGDRKEDEGTNPEHDKPPQTREKQPTSEETREGKNRAGDKPKSMDHVENVHKKAAPKKNAADNEIGKKIRSTKIEGRGKDTTDYKHALKHGRDVD